MAFKDVPGFEAWLDKQVVETKRAYLSSFEELVEYIWNGIIDKTPVDTGTTVANWQLSIDTAKENVVNNTDPGRETTKQAGLSTLSKLKHADTVYITNNYRSISFLEEGHSKQAPAGMVALTFAEAEAIFGIEISGGFGPT